MAVTCWLARAAPCWRESAREEEEHTFRPSSQGVTPSKSPFAMREGGRENNVEGFFLGGPFIGGDIMRSKAIWNDHILY